MALGCFALGAVLWSEASEANASDVPARLGGEALDPGDDVGAPSEVPNVPLVQPGVLSAPVDLSDDGVYLAAEADDLRALPPGSAQGGKVIFVNFGGATLTAGPATLTGDNSALNRSVLCAGAYPPFGAGPAQAAVFQMVVEAFAPYAVQVTDQRPASGSYSMAMVGPTAGVGSGPLGCPSSYGRAHVDCGDANPNNIAIVNHRAGGNGNRTIAATIMQEVAHAYGLEHVSSPGEYLNPVVDDSTNRFGKACAPLQAQMCASQHAKHCPSGGQNSDAELKAILGEKAPDPTPPTVAVTYPMSGATFCAGVTFNIEVTAMDMGGIASVEAFVNDGSIGKSAAPYKFPAANIPAGQYKVTAKAKDTAGNEATSAPVVFTVMAGCTGSSGSGGSMTTAGAGGTAGSVSSSATSYGPAGGVPPGGEGCACQAGGALGEVYPWLGSLGLLLSGLARSRRRRRLEA